MVLQFLRIAASIFLVYSVVLTGCSYKSSQKNEYDYRILAPSNKLIQPGDPEQGLDYLLHGDYIGSGLPYDLFGDRLGRNDQSGLHRDGKNANLSEGLNVFKSDQGVDVIAGLNCFACHATTFEGKFVIGLGNSDVEMNGYTTVSAGSALLQNMVDKKYGAQSPESEVSHQFLRGFNAVAPHIETPFGGINPAFRIEETAALHRDPIDLTWQEIRVFDYLPYTIASDTPPWWHVKKKHGLYYNGMGRGAFSKMMEQISVVGIKDSTQARKIHNHFDDVLAYIETLEPPKYPRKVNTPLASKGQSIFIQNCETCHGNYGEDEQYPNKLIPVDEVKTDPYYARMLYDSPITKWYNLSWYATSEPRSSMQPTMAYIAPPLDGIWCSAPYLHNGSVPNIYALLKSKDRPRRWTKTSDKEYDYEYLGWVYKIPDSGEGGRTIYDTRIKGYDNGGHTYGDHLSDKERLALIEYLKTL